jgi:cupin fold WbuC family metalloprotein
MTKIYTCSELAALTTIAQSADRLRTNLNVHESLDAPVQRLFIATEPGTYIRPHRHPQPNKWELFVVLSGAIDLLIFDDNGTLLKRTKMSPTATQAVEIPAGTWHGYACQETGTVALEVKEGPYIPTTEADFAPWSPAEGSAEASAYQAWMSTAQPS